MCKINIILGVLSLFVGIVGGVGIYTIYHRNILKEKYGEKIWGKKLNCNEIWGRPIRYVVEVEYQLNNSIHLGKIVTTDKRIKECKDNEQIQLLYVDKLNKIFWVEDYSHEQSVYILLLIIFCFFMFLLSGIFLLQS